MMMNNGFKMVFYMNIMVHSILAIYEQNSENRIDTFLEAAASNKVSILHDEVVLANDQVASV